MVGLVMIVYLLIFVLFYYVVNMVYVKIIVIILFVCVMMDILDIDVKSLIFVWKNYVKIMEYVFYILMDICVVVWIYGWVRNVINKMFVF